MLLELRRDPATWRAGLGLSGLIEEEVRLREAM